MSIETSGWNCPFSIYPGESADLIKAYIVGRIKIEAEQQDYEGCPDGESAYKIVVREMSEEKDPSKFIFLNNSTA